MPHDAMGYADAISISLMEGRCRALRPIAWDCVAEVVDHQLVLGWRLYRQVGGLLALEDSIDIAGRAPERVGRIRPVGNQSTAGHEIAKGVDRGQLVPSGQRDD